MAYTRNINPGRNWQHCVASTVCSIECALDFVVLYFVVIIPWDCSGLMRSICPCLSAMRSEKHRNAFNYKKRNKWWPMYVIHGTYFALNNVLVHEMMVSRWFSRLLSCWTREESGVTFSHSIYIYGFFRCDYIVSSKKTVVLHVFSRFDQISVML